MDRRTNRRMDTTSHRVACPQLKETEPGCLNLDWSVSLPLGFYSSDFIVMTLPTLYAECYWKMFVGHRTRFIGWFPSLTLLCPIEALLRLQIKQCRTEIRNRHSGLILSILQSRIPRSAAVGFVNIPKYFWSDLWYYAIFLYFLFLSTMEYHFNMYYNIRLVGIVMVFFLKNG